MSSDLQFDQLEATKLLLDVSVTERMEFKTCRRRWWFTTIENLEPKLSEDLAFEFGGAMHRALEAFYSTRRKGVNKDKAYAELDKSFKALKAEADNDLVWKTVVEHETLGHEMLRHYLEYDSVARVKLGDVIAVEGKVLQGAGVKPSPPEGYGPATRVRRHESGRLLVPIVHPVTKEPLVEENTKEIPYLTGRIDLLTERKTPHRGLWITDHKTAASAPNDKGLDFDDQVTGYCYVVWRWTGVIPRGVIYNVLVKKTPKEPRIVQSKVKGEELTVSTAKDQLTLPRLYRDALKEYKLITPGGRIPSEAHAQCMAALLERGWDPFFKRMEVTRNEHQMQSYEERLYTEYEDMLEAHDFEAKRYPSPSTRLCPYCPVRSICLAIEDGSDFEDVIEFQFKPKKDRKA